MPFFEKKNSEKGQILLIVVLAAVISLTVGLSAVSRSITNTRVSTEESNSQKALSAAEAGLEEQIKKATQNNLENSGGTFSNNSGFTAKSKKIEGYQILVNNYELPVKKHEGADVWLSDYPNFDNPKTTYLAVYWTDTPGSTNCNQDPAIEIVLIYGDRANPSLNRYAVDSCRTRGNGFSAPDGGTAVLSGKTFDHYYTLPLLISQGYIARIMPIYADSKIGFSSSVPLPAQGYEIESVGTSGDTVRKVKVFQSFPNLPIEFFPYNLFNP